MALFVELDVSLKTVSICIVKADGTVVWEGKALSEPASLIKALARRRNNIQLVGIEACPLSEWLYAALVDSGFTTICIETRHAQRFLSSRPNKTDGSDARGIADMMRFGHYRPVRVKSREAQLLRTTLIARRTFVGSGPFPSGRSRPIARHSRPRDGAALAGSRCLRPFGLRSLPRRSRQPYPATGRAVVEPGRTRMGGQSVTISLSTLVLACR